jgi:hypothetical protein
MKARTFLMVIALLALLAWRGNDITTRVFGVGIVDAHVVSVRYLAGDPKAHVEVQVEALGPSYGKRVDIALTEEVRERTQLVPGSAVRINLDERGNAILN